MYDILSIYLEYVVYLLLFNDTERHFQNQADKFGFGSDEDSVKKKEEEADLNKDVEERRLNVQPVGTYVFLSLSLFYIDIQIH